MAFRLLNFRAENCHRRLLRRCGFRSGGWQRSRFLSAQPTRQCIGKLLRGGPTQMHGIDEGAYWCLPLLVRVPVDRAGAAETGEDALVEVSEEGALRVIFRLPFGVQWCGNDHKS